MKRARYWYCVLKFTVVGGFPTPVDVTNVHPPMAAGDPEEAAFSAVKSPTVLVPYSNIGPCSSTPTLLAHVICVVVMELGSAKVTNSPETPIR